MEPVESDRHNKAADAVHEGRPVAARFVRSGGKGSSVVPILVVSTVGAALILLLLYSFWLGPLGKAQSDGAQQSIQDDVAQQQQTPAKVAN